jgi:ketosteroid isomerase-like protein
MVSALYRSFAERDVVGLSACLSDRFVGHVSMGMPCGVGGVHDGREAMIGEVWVRVFQDFDVSPVPERVGFTGDGQAVVHGHYRGTRRADGASIAAEFVHLLRFDLDGRVVELRQITDTASWTA